MCLNGMVLGKDIASYKSKHVDSLDMEKASEAIMNALEAFHASGEWFNYLSDRKVTDTEAYACLAHASACREAIERGYTSTVEFMPPVMKKLIQSWQDHKRSMGSNAWALYNTMTYYSTHWDKDSKRRNLANARAIREENVQKTLDSFDFLKMAA